MILLEMEAVSPRELTLRTLLDQYEGYLGKLTAPPIEEVAEELLDLIHVAFLKSHSLLPLPPPLPEELVIPELKKKLKELSLYTALGELLLLKPLWNWDRFPRGMREPLPPPWVPLIPKEELIRALARIYDRNYRPPLPFSYEPRPTIKEELPRLFSLLERGDGLTLDQLLSRDLPLLRRVYRFILLLELIRLGGVEIEETSKGLTLRKGERFSPELFDELLTEEKGVHAD
jgi:chromatin segregation and condensation protein Rec8/ScpA/Scc1 (kleisin family)